MPHQQNKLVLASASPQRRKLLRQAGIACRVVPSAFKEPDAARFSAKEARQLVLDLALAKAQNVAQKIRQDQPTFNGAVLGADTVVTVQNEIFGKPKNVKDAARMLRLLSNNWQAVWTGLAWIELPSFRIKKRAVKTRLKFHPMTEKEITRLAAINLDKSGAYAIQKMNDAHLKKIHGDFENVIGLPTFVVRQWMDQLQKMEAKK